MGASPLTCWTPAEPTVAGFSPASTTSVGAESRWSRDLPPRIPSVRFFLTPACRGLILARRVLLTPIKEQYKARARYSMMKRRRNSTTPLQRPGRETRTCLHLDRGSTPALTSWTAGAGNLHEKAPGELRRCCDRPTTLFEYASGGHLPSHAKSITKEYAPCESSSSAVARSVCSARSKPRNTPTTFGSLRSDRLTPAPMCPRFPIRDCMII